MPKTAVSLKKTDASLDDGTGGRKTMIRRSAVCLENTEIDRRMNSFPRSATKVRQDVDKPNEPQPLEKLSHGPGHVPPIKSQIM